MMVDTATKAPLSAADFTLQSGQRPPQAMFRATPTLAARSPQQSATTAAIEEREVKLLATRATEHFPPPSTGGGGVRKQGRLAGSPKQDHRHQRKHKQARGRLIRVTPTPRSGRA